MKANKYLFLSILSIGLALTACGGSGESGGSSTPSYVPTKLPETKYEKVNYAFSGVERALKNTSYYSSSNLTPKAKISEPSDATLTTIFNVLENQGSAIAPDVGYNDTPLIQFQYLKALYVECGESFEFNTKYSHTFTGTMYFDFATDEIVTGEEYLHNYTLVFSVILNIDDNDFITSKVGFDLTFTHENIVRHEYMYAELFLDYDMQDVNPSFTFMMRDITDLLMYPNEEERLLTAEYDYIDVKSGQIKEWRKFGIAAKSSFNNYLDENFVYKYVALRGFKNSTNYKNTDPFRKDSDLLDAVLNGLGLRDTFNSYKPFYSISSIENDKIATVVNRMSQIYGKEFVYHVAESGADEEWEGHSHPEEHNRFMMLIRNNEVVDTYIEGRDYSIQQVFNNCNVFLLQDNYEFVEEITDYSKLDIKVHSNCYDEAEWVAVTDLSKRFSELIVESGFKYDENGKVSMDMEVSLKDDPEVKMISYINLCVDSGDFAKNLAKAWPGEYLNKYIPVKDSIPVFNGDNVYFRADFITEFKDGELVIKGYEGSITLFEATYSEVDGYHDELLLNGYRDYVDYYSGMVMYSYKRVDDTYVLKLELGYPGGKEGGPGLIRFTFEESQIADKTIREVILGLFDNESIEVPEFSERDDYSFYEDYKENNRIIIASTTVEEVKDYIRKFEYYGFTICEEEYQIFAYLYLDGVMYRVKSASEKGLTVHVTPLVMSFVGLDDNWDVNNEDYVLTQLTVGGRDMVNPYYFSFKHYFKDGERFKVVINHDWAQGSYGYDQFFEGEKPDGNIRPEGEYNNIQVVNAANYEVRVGFDLVDIPTLAERIEVRQIKMSQWGFDPFQ